MNVNTTLTQFCKEWNEEQPKVAGAIKVMPYEYCGDIYGAEIRFPGTAYECDTNNFRTLSDWITRKSGGTVSLSSSWYDFKNGILTLNVACCNHGYEVGRVISTLEVLLREVFPDYKK